MNRPTLWYATNVRWSLDRFAGSSRLNAGSPSRRESIDQIVIDLDGLEAGVTVIRSARRRRSIAITVESKVVRLRVPMRTTRNQIEDAVQKHRTWILARLSAPAAQPPSLTYTTGEAVSYLGRELTLVVREVAARRIAVRREGDSILVDVASTLVAGARSDALKAALTRWYRSEATELFADLIQTWSARSGLVPGKVHVRDQRRRWGSCGSDGTLRLNWRLVLLDRELAEYVVVHELAHLRHRNHQAEFWAEVARLLPDHLQRRKRLTAIGRKLLH